MIDSPKFFGPSDPQVEARLTASGVTFGYEDGLSLIAGCDAKLPLRGAFRIQGALGSGVSTVMKLFAGLLTPRSGIVQWGEQGADTPSRMLDAKWRLSSAYLQRAGGLLANQTLVSNAAFPLVYHGWLSESEAIELANRYFDLAGIRSEAARLPAWSSPNARKLCVLIRALLPQPQLLIADEPFEGMHAQAVDASLRLIRWHREQKSLRLVLVGSAESAWDSKLDLKRIGFSNGNFEKSSWEET